jgi:histidinol dehydrogenase
VQVRARRTALVELTERFDGAKLTTEQLAVTQAELMAASLKADESLRAAVSRGGREYRQLRQEVPTQRLVDEEFPRSDGRRKI